MGWWLGIFCGRAMSAQTSDMCSGSPRARWQRYAQCHARTRMHAQGCCCPLGCVGAVPCLRSYVVTRLPDLTPLADANKAFRFLAPGPRILAPLPSGPLALWPSGPLAPWPPGPLAPWPRGPLASWPSGPLAGRRQKAFRATRPTSIPNLLGPSGLLSTDGCHNIHSGVTCV